MLTFVENKLLKRCVKTGLCCFCCRIVAYNASRSLGQKQESFGNLQSRVSCGLVKVPQV